MNISDIRDEIKSLVNKEIMLKVSGSRAKTTMMKGIVNEVYSNIFTYFCLSNSATNIYSVLSSLLTGK